MPFKQRFHSFYYVLVRSSWRLQIFVCFFLDLNWKWILVFCLLAFYVFSTFVWKLILFLTVDLVYILTGTLFTIQRSESIHRRRDKFFFLKVGATSWIQEPRIGFFVDSLYDKWWAYLPTVCLINCKIFIYTEDILLEWHHFFFCDFYVKHTKKSIFETKLKIFLRNTCKLKVWHTYSCKTKFRLNQRTPISTLSAPIIFLSVFHPNPGKDLTHFCTRFCIMLNWLWWIHDFLVAMSELFVYGRSACWTGIIK